MRPYYENESVQLFWGDCRDVLPTLERVDHVITDPPYARDVYVRLGMPNTKEGSGTPGRLRGYEYSHVSDRKKGRVRKGITNHQYSSMSIEKLAAGDIGAVDDILDGCASEFARLTTRWCLVFSDVETCHVWRRQLEDSGLRYVRTGAWVKPDPMPQFSGDRPATGFEPATICHAQGPMRWNGGGMPAMWTYNTAKGAARPDHPCPKPLPLMEQLVRDFTDPNDLILDPFAGSGTTLVAAQNLGRRAIGIELSERWCHVAAERLSLGPLFEPLPEQGAMQL